MYKLIKILIISLLLIEIVFFYILSYFGSLLTGWLTNEYTDLLVLFSFIMATVQLVLVYLFSKKPLNYRLHLIVTQVIIFIYFLVSTNKTHYDRQAIGLFDLIIYLIPILTIGILFFLKRFKSKKSR